jgi:two-component system, chemotaxis family, chemotaxis protein CheY
VRPDTVLIVEDDDDLRESLSVLLVRKGFRVETAQNGRIALDWIEVNGPPRIILLDLMMPVMDGWELRRRLLLDARWKSVPVVVISGVADAGDHAKALEAVDCLVKPIDPRRLYRILEREA